jgi:hypothetical protein
MPEIEEIYVDNFKDPENVEDIKETLKTLPTMKDILDLINKVFPNWIVTFFDKYSNDYPHLDKNWELITKELNIPKSQILIVENIYNKDDEEHLLINLFCDIFTRSGFIVRRKNEIFPCEVCNAAIPNNESYNKMKESNIQVPETWTQKCTTCN